MLKKRMLNSQKKGKNYELKIAKDLNKAFETNVRRTPCSGGLGFKGDIIDLSGVLKDYHFECKNQESLNVWKAIKQAKRDCPIQKNWVLVFSRNFENDDYCTMRFETFKNLLLTILELQN